jgi:superfamily II DNA or RNA helicase
MLRPYQDRFCKSILTGFKEYQRLLGVMPTGGGKTICFAHLASIARGRTLILAHREELIDQAVDKITRFTGTPVSIEMGDRRSTPTKIVVASIQSMVRRRDQFKPDEFSLIVADEAHMSLSFQWRSVLDYFNSKVLGVTATPHRGDKQNLGKYYESCASEITMQELVAAGFLCRIKLIQFPVRIDISAVRVTDGDYNESDMDAVIRPLMKGIVEHLMEWRDRKILAFVPLIHTSVYFVEACRNAGLNAVHIDGTSPDRKQILARYSEGAFNILSNSMLLSHGYDEPSIDAILLLRPTKSQPLMAQEIGRGTRIHPGKSELLVLDPIWIGTRHPLCRPVNLIATDEKESEMMAKKAAEKDGWDLFDLQSQVVSEREASIKKEIESHAKRNRREIDPLTWAAGIKRSVDIVEYEPVFAWEKQSPSPAQINLLKRFGISTEGIRYKGRASKLIGMIMDRTRSKLATPRQLVLMEQLGIPDCDKLSFKDASLEIGKRIGRNKTDATT